MSSLRMAGQWLVFASVTFWLAWWLMPDAATNDAAHILVAVGAHRASVQASVVVQIVSSAAFVPACLGIARNLPSTASRRTTVGLALLVIGAMGMCADAFFHQMAIAMTGPDVASAAMLAPMLAMQTRGVMLLVTLLLPFFVGAFATVTGARRDGLVSGAPRAIALGSLALVAVGGVGVRAMGSGRGTLALCFLALVAMSLAKLGVEIGRK